MPSSTRRRRARRWWWWWRTPPRRLPSRRLPEPEQRPRPPPAVGGRAACGKPRFRWAPASAVTLYLHIMGIFRLTESLVILFVFPVHKCNFKGFLVTFKRMTLEARTSPTSTSILFLIISTAPPHCVLIGEPKKFQFWMEEMTWTFLMSCKDALHIVYEPNLAEFVWF